MHFSVSTGRKSGSGWLDRLRTKNDAVPLLQNPNPRIPNPNRDSEPPNNELYSVLNELFNFGDNFDNSSRLKKSLRKQPNPRNCAFSSGGAHNVGLERAGSGDSNNGVEGVDERGGEEGKDVGLLAGFSRMEVTVIDTSYECWKVEKMLYRKKNVWKVREKRGKSESVGSKKKKRKVSGSGDECGEKRQKVGGNENEVCRPNVLLKAHVETSERTCKTLKQKQTDLKMESGNTSVILIKSIPASKKPGNSISKVKQSKS